MTAPISCNHKSMYRGSYHCFARELSSFPSTLQIEAASKCMTHGSCAVKPDEDKTCPVCGKVFNPSKMKIAFLDFDFVHYCSSRCKNQSLFNKSKKEGRSFFWSSIASSIIVRDNMACRLCGSKENLTVHHMIPVAVGGTSEDWNLITLCHTCHMKVHSSLRGHRIQSINEKMSNQQDIENYLEVKE